MSAAILQATVRGMTVDDLPAVLEIDRLSFALPWPERSFRFELTDPVLNRTIAHVYDVVPVPVVG